LVLANRSLVIQECEEPWQNLPKCTEGNDSVLIVGMKNSGKSSLSEYLLHQR
jgi:polynucleotide 5'-kinase involved in rRNA processing